MIFKAIILRQSLLPISYRVDCRKSRRDDILLTVGFNLRTGNVMHFFQSLAETTQTLHQTSTNRDGVVSSLRDLGDGLFHMLRRLKSTVNKVLSLRDIDKERIRSISPLIQPHIQVINSSFH